MSLCCRVCFLFFGYSDCGSVRIFWNRQQCKRKFDRQHDERMLDLEGEKRFEMESE